MLTAFNHLLGLTRQVTGQAYAVVTDYGAVTVAPDEAPDLLRPGLHLSIAGPGVRLAGWYFYRGPAVQDGHALGFAAADEMGGLLLFSDDAPARDRPVFIGGRQDPLLGFAPGTAIATPNGTTLIEDLLPGDTVLTTPTPAEPVIRIARRLASPLFADPLYAAPIRIAAGALGHGLPRRDLVVSADHAVLLGNTLVQAGAMVNGRSVRREPADGTVVTLQIELAADALVIAEGVALDSCRALPRQLKEPAPEPDEETAPPEPAEPLLDYARATSHRQVPTSLRAVLAAAR